jgi:hypothetical protein
MSGSYLYSAASFSCDRTYRYSLTRTWDRNLPIVNVIGLNPSTADEHQDDPTIRRCLAFARREGFGSLVMTNIFAYRATDPKALRSASDPEGPQNNDFLIELAEASSQIWAAWGCHGGFRERGPRVVSILPWGQAVWCFGTNRDGTPKHPLYLPSTARLQLYA